MRGALYLVRPVLRPPVRWLLKQVVPVRLRLVLACVRMLLACLVLGVVAPSASAAPCVDEMGWQVDSVAPRPSDAEAPSTSRVASRERGPGPVLHVARTARRTVPRAPTRARERVAHRRVYLRHASLLR
jgi:hypothetical protein